MSETLQFADAIAGSGVPDTLASGYSIEALPRQLMNCEDLTALLPTGTSVYVPCLAGSDFSETVAACRNAQEHGMVAVPHIPARALASEGQLGHDLSALQEAGITSVLLIAGDNTSALGPFASTLQVLETGLIEQHGICRVGFAAHPDGHPFADDGALRDAMRQKLAFGQATATDVWFVTQMTFEAQTVLDWLGDLAEGGLAARVRVGIPGPAKMRTLLSFAMKLGVAKSARAFSQRPETARLLFGQWTPEKLLVDLDGARRDNPALAVEGVHVFAFGGLGHSAEWMRSAGQLRQSA